MYPVQLTAFVGRAHEVSDVRRHLSGASRLVTITGVGGSGKTRLALEVAAQLEAEGRAVGWVELAGLSDPELTAYHMAEQLGLREQRTASATQAIIELVRDRELVLVVDNCEHLVDSAAGLVEALLRACPRLRVLATSREPLAIAGERAWLVPPLRDHDASRLFVERAQDVVPAFTLDDGNAALIAEICRRLDGLPLAIELAAARVRVLSPAQIVERLEDRFRLLASGSRNAIPRHQTLRAAIDWSYTLLTADEQRLLDRLSVFSGGFTLEAAEGVCATTVDEALAVLDVLARLVDRSLVTMREVGGSARYALLETVRQYAAEHLRARDEEALLRRRHAGYFHDLVAAAEPYLITAQRRPWLDRVHTEIDNLRQALTWTRDSDPACHLRLTGMLCWFWFSTGFWSEGRRWAEEALTMPVAAGPTPARAATLFAAAVIACLQAKAAVAQRWLEETVEIARAHGDRRLEAYAQNYLGMALVQQLRPEGERPVREAMAWFRAEGDLYGLRLSLLLVASLRLGQRDFGRALPALEEAVQVARTFGLPRELGIALQMLGYGLLVEGDVERATPLLLESMAALRQDPQYMFLARGLELLGIVNGKRGRSDDAARMLGAGEALRETIGAAMMETDRQAMTPRIAELRDAMGADAFAAAWAAGRALSLDAALELAPSAPVAAPASPQPSVVEPVRAEVPVLSVRALGPLEIRASGAPEGDAWSSAKARELVVYLLCHPRGRTRAEIGLDFWPDASAAQVKNSFHVLLHRVRKSLGRAELVVLEDERYRIDPSAGVWFDADVFERAVRAARSEVEPLARAVELYRGDLLDGEPAGEWHVERQAQLRRRHHDALATLAGAHLDAAQPEAAVSVLERLLALDPLREDAHRRLMLAYARLGQRDRALDQYGHLLAVLDDELDAAPDRATVDLAARIRRAEPL
ncbi:MAG TPA: BTAD domain-containing putative transcriptional regulator [Kofleriaceae bacterium]|nr:BTAD domain-containing putative transcriptional regulator [Kofleriaceae bacterium]